MSRKLLAMLLGSSLVALPLSSTLANENSGSFKTAPSSFSSFALPTVPHLDTVLWLNSGFDLKKQPNRPGPRLDTLWPLLINPNIAPARFSSNEKCLDAVADFQKFLPPLPSIPWVETRSIGPQKGAPSWKANGVNAWLPAARSVPSRSSSNRQEASAETRSVGM